MGLTLLMGVVFEIACFYFNLYENPKDNAIAQIILPSIFALALTILLALVCSCVGEYIISPPDPECDLWTVPNAVYTETDTRLFPLNANNLFVYSNGNVGYYMRTQDENGNIINRIIEYDSFAGLDVQQVEGCIPTLHTTRITRHDFWFWYDKTFHTITVPPNGYLAK